MAVHHSPTSFPRRFARGKACPGLDPGMKEGALRFFISLMQQPVDVLNDLNRAGGHVSAAISCMLASKVIFSFCRGSLKVHTGSLP
jgi:hypothetical protein